MTRDVTAEVSLISSPGRDTTTTESAPELTEFTFDELIVQKESFVLHNNHTLTIQQDGSYAFRMDMGPDHAAQFQLSRAAMAVLESLLKQADDLNEPPLEELASDPDEVKSLFSVLEQARSDDPGIRYWEAGVRTRRAGIQMGTDGTWFTFTLVRDGENTVLSRYQRELELPPIQPLVRFMDRIHTQEQFYQRITDDERDWGDALLSLNLSLDRALGRRNLNEPPPLLPLDHGRFAANGGVRRVA